MIGLISMEKYENRKRDSVGSSRIRGRWLWEAWSECEEYQIGKKYDVLIFQKCYWRRMLEDFKGIKIFDLCDPDHLDQRPIVETLTHCDALVTSTERLAEYYRKITDIPVICIPDRIKLSEHKPVKELKNDWGNGKKAVWFGFSQNFKYVERTFNVLKSEGVELTVISNQTLAAPSEYQPFSVKSRKYDHATIYEELIKADFALLPEPNDIRGGFKSNNKDLTCWALKLPVAKQPEDIKRFADLTERKKEAEAKYKEVKKNWTMDKSVRQWKDLMRSL